MVLAGAGIDFLNNIGDMKMLRNSLLAAVAVLGLSIGSAQADSNADAFAGAAGQTLAGGGATFGIAGGLDWTSLSANALTATTYNTTSTGTGWWNNVTTGAGSALATGDFAVETMGVAGSLSIGPSYSYTIGAVEGGTVLGTSVDLPFGVGDSAEARANGAGAFNTVASASGLVTGTLTGGYSSISGDAGLLTAGASIGNRPLGIGSGVAGTVGTANFSGVSITGGSAFAFGPGYAQAGVSSSSYVGGAARTAGN